MLKSILFSAVFLVAVSSVIFLQSNYPQKSITEGLNFKFNERQPTVSADGLRFISFGYSRLLSNLLWIKFLQESPLNKVPPDELSWIYFDLDTISTVDPEFHPVFEHGGVFLSVITEDRRGAEQLLLKGVKAFPDRWRIFAYLAYNYQVEMGEPEKAGQYYLAASKLPGAPAIMGMLAARHMAKTESIAESIAFLEQLKANSREDEVRKKFQARIDMWKEKLSREGKHE